ncbi:hypothetical protein Y1Q_0022470 [Alligator mississippiensis]|uniref:Uncharacterized protein n=1 Tax=Alligator mississippiensis TaxID=8496 RepID=A0A151N0S5_ALLMI|nr:hypothetical protein Y1Q_0022470 [Alligator mississippiensis]
MSGGKRGSPAQHVAVKPEMLLPKLKALLASPCHCRIPPGAFQSTPRDPSVLQFNNAHYNTVPWGVISSRIKSSLLYFADLLPCSWREFIIWCL